MRKNTRKVGYCYEDLAASYLYQKGYRIMERNFRNRFGEIDIIALAPDGTLVMAEVKYRNSDLELEPLEAVTVRKRRQISYIALFYLNKIKAADDAACRFDVIGIDRTGRITHIENAFDFTR